MHGWRAKLGIMVPSANTTIESDYHKINIEGVSFHYSRLAIEADTKEEIENLFNEVPRAAEELADADVDIISFGCTAGSFVGGPNYDKKIIEKIEQTTKKKGTTTSTAVIKALKALDLKKIIIATPYVSWINEKEVNFFEKNGFKVLKIKGLDLLKNQGNYPPEKIYKMVKEMYKEVADGIFISCTDFRGMDIIDLLETDLEVPVVTSNQATLWDMLRLVRVNEKIENYGKLLREF